MFTLIRSVVSGSKIYKLIINREFLVDLQIFDLTLKTDDCCIRLYHIKMISETYSAFRSKLSYKKAKLL